MVATGRPAVLLEHVVLLEIPFVAKIAEQPFWLWLWLWLWLWSGLWSWLRLWFRLWLGLWLGLWLWLDLRAFAHVIVIDCDVSIADQASGLLSLKLEVAKIRHGGFGRRLLWRVMLSIRTGTIVDIGNAHRGRNRLSRSLGVLSSFLGLSKVSP